MTNNNNNNNHTLRQRPNAKKKNKKDKTKQEDNDDKKAAAVAAPPSNDDNEADPPPVTLWQTLKGHWSMPFYAITVAVFLPYFLQTQYVYLLLERPDWTLWFTRRPPRVQ